MMTWCYVMTMTTTSEQSLLRVTGRGHRPVSGINPAALYLGETPRGTCKHKKQIIMSESESVTMLLIKTKS